MSVCIYQEKYREDIPKCNTIISEEVWKGYDIIDYYNFY